MILKPALADMEVPTKLKAKPTVHTLCTSTFRTAHFINTFSHARRQKNRCIYVRTRAVACFAADPFLSLKMACEAARGCRGVLALSLARETGESFVANVFLHCMHASCSCISVCRLELHFCKVHKSSELTPLGINEVSAAG